MHLDLLRRQAQRFGDILPIVDQQAAGRRFGKLRSALTATQMRDKLIDDEDLDLPSGSKKITLIVHACFTGGTVENPPTTATRDSVFAGQQVTFGGDGDRDGFLVQGASVTWA
jgi:hypothetical protein